jgi:Domain of unknown function (DUF932)
MQNLQQNQTVTPFGWDIVQSNIYANSRQITSHKAIFRKDNYHLLNVAKTSYTPTTNARFIEVVGRMSEVTGFPIRCYDEFEGGKKVLAFLECVEPIEVQGHQFQDYMLIGNSHDSSTGFFIGNSSKMIRCSNRFSKVFRQLQVHHTRNHDTKIEQLLGYFQTFMAERKQLFTKMEQFAKVQIDDSIKEALVQRLTRMNQEEILGTKEISIRKENVMNSLWQSIDKECLALGDNLFGLFNGATHYSTHVKKAKEPIFGNCLGSLARMNDDAFQFCEQQLFEFSN